MNRKIIWCSIVLVLVLGGSLAYVISCAREDVLVNTADSGGAIVFLDNDSHGTFALGRASADFRKNTVASSTVPSVETGTEGSSTYTATWEQDGNTEPGDAKKAVFTLTVWDPAGVPHSTTMESGELPRPEGRGFLLHPPSIEASPQAQRCVPHLIPRQGSALAGRTS